MSTKTRVLRSSIAGRAGSRLSQFLAGSRNFFEEFGRAVRAARSHSELSRLSDDELRALGLSREQIAEHVFSEHLIKPLRSKKPSI